MVNPYKVLGVAPTATDEEVKRAYRELAKKYHPDNYNDSPLKSVAEEKMAEVNEAFQQIMSERKIENSGGQSQGYNSYNNSSYSSNTSGKLRDVRAMIQQGRLVDAEEVLDGIPASARDAEWYFLKGSIFYNRGWLEDAMNHFSTACRLNPHNPEYNAAMNRMMWQRQGNFGGGFNTNTNPYRTQQNVGGCSACDMCSGLICADCCCECMGGDLIACC